jgi:hypothetical protein
VVVELAIFRVEEKLTIRRRPSFVGGLRVEGDPSWRPGAFVVTRISPTVISLLHVSQHPDTSSSPRASVISIPKFIYS